MANNSDLHFKSSRRGFTLDWVRGGIESCDNNVVGINKCIVELKKVTDPTVT